MTVSTSVSKSLVHKKPKRKPIFKSLFVCLFFVVVCFVLLLFVSLFFVCLVGFFGDETSILYCLRLARR